MRLTLHPVLKVGARDPVFMTGLGHSHVLNGIPARDERMFRSQRGDELPIGPEVHAVAVHGFPEMIRHIISE
jgi:hypothetical protein